MQEGVPVIGLLGILLLAKRQQLNPSARRLFERLEQESGMYLAAEVRDQASGALESEKPAVEKLGGASGRRPVCPGTSESGSPHILARLQWGIDNHFAVVICSLAQAPLKETSFIGPF